MSGNGLGDANIPFTGRSRMRAIADTIGMSTPQRANFWLEHLAYAAHRGPRVDTWASARDRAAKRAGISRSMAERIWHRWRDMKDVSGEAVLSLMQAYERMCETTEIKRAAMREERIRIGEDYAVIAGARGHGGGVDHIGHR